MGLFMPGNMPGTPFSVFLSAEFSKTKDNGSLEVVQVNVGDTFYTEYATIPYLITSFVFVKHKLHET
jgi:hypothetical protein